MFMQTAASSKEIYQGCVGTLERHEEDFERPWGDPFLGEELLPSSKSNMRVYPNPVKSSLGQLHVNVEDDIKQIALTTIAGNHVDINPQITGGQALLYIDNLANGLYIVRVSTDESIYSEKILVQH
ncbi:MAG: hypothetical protein Salg2KO_15070 [Salibacteraceae bacterium]